ncbi:hypothetical protein IGI01_04220 [Bacillus thuringiensis]|nr:hypothetical protein [Bacillus thuringiensis]
MKKARAIALAFFDLIRENVVNRWIMKKEAIPIRYFSNRFFVFQLYSYHPVKVIRGKTVSVYDYFCFWYFKLFNI